MEGPSLEDIFRYRGFVCPSCQNTYTTSHGTRIPLTVPERNRTQCEECWKSEGHNPNSIEFWFNKPIGEELDEIVLLHQHANGVIGEDDCEWKKHLLLEHAIHRRWDAIIAHPDGDLGQWKGTSRHVIVEACEHPDCPAEVIKKLLSLGAPMFEARPCLNPGGIGAMTAAVVCAEKGSLDALKALVEADVYPGGDHTCHVVTKSIEHAQLDILEFVLGVQYSYSNGHEMVNTTVGKYCGKYSLEQTAKVFGTYQKIIRVLESFYDARGC